MTKRLVKLIVVAVCFCCSVQAQDEQPVAPPKPFGPVPTAAQMARQQMDMNMFCHFDPNTFTGKEWGDGTEIEDIFHPTALNCDQWATVAKSAETDVSIRPGWFYRDSENPKTLQELLKIYYTSVGRNSLLLLNVPPDQRGRIAAEDSVLLGEFRQALDQIFGFQNNLFVQNYQKFKIYASNIRGVKDPLSCCYTWKGTRNSCELQKGSNGDLYGTMNIVDNATDKYWATDDNVTTASLDIEFSTPQTFNRVLLQEYIPLGQRVEQFHIEVMNEDGTWRTIAEETTIGYKRIVLTEKVTTKKVRIVIDKSRACIVLNKIGLYLDTISEFDTL